MAIHLQERYGRWTVLKPDLEYTAHDKAECLCDCGEFGRVRVCNLTQGRSKSCGCLRHDSAPAGCGTPWPDLAPTRHHGGRVMPGAQFGRWTVLDGPHYNEQGLRVVLCECECGTLREISPSNLSSRRTKSCGCYRSEGARMRARALPRAESECAREAEVQELS